MAKRGPQPKTGKMEPTEHGSSYTNEKGWQAPRPEVSLQTQKVKLMMIFAKEFGFTPG